MTTENPALRPGQFYWAIAGLFAASILSRFWGLADWPLDGDEIITFRRGHERLWTFISPAYYWLWEASTNVLGLTAFSTRLPSALMGVVAIPVFALTWRRIVGDRAALLGALAALFCGWHLSHSQWARYYAGVFLFASLSYYFYCRAIQADSQRFLVASVVAGGIAALFHPSAAAVPASCFIATLLFWAGGEALGAPPIGRRVLRMHLLLAAIGTVLVLPLVVRILGSWTVDGLPPPGAALWIIRFAKNVEISTLLLAMAGWLMMLASDRRLAVFLAVGVGVPLMLAIVGAEFMGMREDYAFLVVPLILLAAGIFLDRATQSLYGVLRSAVTATLLFLFLPTFASYYLERASLDVRDAVTYVESNWQPGDQVLPFTGAFRFYAPDSLNLIQPEALRPQNMRGREAPSGGWHAVLQPVLDHPGRTWIVIRQSRNPQRPQLVDWLGTHSRLVWRRYATRLDEEVDGFEIWLVEPAVREAS